MMMRRWYGQGRRKKEEEQGGTECQRSERGLGHGEKGILSMAATEERSGGALAGINQRT